MGTTEDQRAITNFGESARSRDGILAPREFDRVGDVLSIDRQRVSVEIEGIVYGEAAVCRGEHPGLAIGDREAGIENMRDPTFMNQTFTIGGIKRKQRVVRVLAEGHRTGRCSRKPELTRSSILIHQRVFEIGLVEERLGRGIIGFVAAIPIGVTPIIVIVSVGGELIPRPHCVSPNDLGRQFPGTYRNE